MPYDIAENDEDEDVRKAAVEKLDTFLHKKTGKEEMAFFHPKRIGIKKIEKGAMDVNKESSLQDWPNEIAKHTEDLKSYLLALYKSLPKRITDDRMETLAGRIPWIEAKNRLLDAVSQRIQELYDLKPVATFIEKTTLSPFFQKYSFKGFRNPKIEFWVSMNAILNLICCYGEKPYCATKDVILNTIKDIEKKQ